MISHFRLKLIRNCSLCEKSEWKRRKEKGEVRLEVSELQKEETLKGRLLKSRGRKERAEPEAEREERQKEEVSICSCREKQR